MSNYTKKNLRGEVENQAPKFGMPDEMESRFARTALGGETLGLSLFTSGTSSKVSASISASDYRDPKPGNNSVSTRVVL